MATDTHCLPSGALGTDELPTPNLTTPNIGVIPATTGVGNRRGVVVLLHGLFDAAVTLPTLPTSNYLTFANDLAGDGWTVLSPPFAEDIYFLPSVAISNDITNDAGNGSRYLNQTLHWWDHMMIYCHANYPSWPIVVFGISWGAWHSLQVAANRTSTLLAFGSHYTLTWLENIWSGISTPANYGLLNTSGLDIQSTLLNAVIIPGIIGYSTADDVVGYSGVTTVAAGSDGTAASAVTTLSVTSNTGIVANSGVNPSVTVTGLTGGSTRATFNYTGLGSNTLTGVTLASGSGTLHTGNPVTQSTTSALIAAQQAAQPGNPVTSYSNTSDHIWLAADTTEFTGWFTSTVDPLAPKVL